MKGMSAHLELLGHKVEVQELEGDPYLPVGGQDRPHVLLQLRHHLMPLTLCSANQSPCSVFSRTAWHGEMLRQALSGHTAAMPLLANLVNDRGSSFGSFWGFDVLVTKMQYAGPPPG